MAIAIREPRRPQMEMHRIMSMNSVSDTVRQFILKQFPQARSRSLSNDEHLLENGIVDSLGVIDIVTFIESEFHLTVEDEDLVPEHFQSIERIAAYVENRQRSVTADVSGS
jgi:acyl carrier protein